MEPEILDPVEQRLTLGRGLLTSCKGQGAPHVTPLPFMAKLCASLENYNILPCLRAGHLFLSGVDVFREFVGSDPEA